jgi:hypothetical protein
MYLPQCVLDGGPQTFEPIGHVTPQMHTQGAAAALGENLEVPPRLGGLDDAEGV